MKSRSISLCGMRRREILSTTSLLVFLFAHTAQAAEVTNTNGDTSAGSLRAAATTGEQIINFDDLGSGGTITLSGPLTFTIASATSWRFTGDTASLTVGGDTITSDGHLYFQLAAGDELTVNSDINFTNSSKLLYVSAGTVTFNGDISAAYALQAAYNGTAIVGTTTSPGTFQLWSDGTLQFATSGTYSAGLRIQDLATIDTGANSVTISGTVLGLGSETLVKAGSGTLTLQGSGSYSGGTRIDAGTLSVAGDGNLGDGAVTLNGGDLTVTGATTINNAISVAADGTIDNSAAVRLSGVISGTGDLTKSGSGTLTLTGTNTLTGSTLIDAGILAVNGSLSSSAVTVNSSGTLGGTGTVGSVTVNGAIAPGNSIGTLNVAGNVDFSGGGVYKVEVNAAGSTDLISATGTATLTNGTVEVAPEAGTYGQSTDYTILTASGGLGGTTFDSVSSTLAFLTPTLTYDANNVFLNLTRNDTSFQSLAQTPNQLAVATVLNDQSSNPALKDLVDNVTVLTGEGARQAYDSLSGVQLTYSSVAAHQAMDRFRQVLFNRGQGPAGAGNAAVGLTGSFSNANVMMAYHDDGAAPESASSASPWQGEGVFSSGGLWLEGLGGVSTIDSTANAEGADLYSGGLAAGVDARLGDFTVGFAGSYLATNVDTDTGRNDIGSYQLAAYGLWQRDTLYANAALSLGVHTADTSRDVTVGSLSRTARGDYTSTGFGMALEAGKSLALLEDTSITPYAGIAYEFLRQDAFEETGAGSMNLSVDEEISNGLRVTLGTRLQHVLKSRDGLALMPYIDLAYVHDASGTAQMDTAFAVAPDNAFSIEGADLDRNRARLGVGATGYLNKNTSLNVAYQGEFSGSDQQHSMSAAFKFRW